MWKSCFYVTSDSLRHLNKHSSTIWGMNPTPGADSVWLFSKCSSSTFLQHPLQKPRNGSVDCTFLCLSCPGMSTVVVLHQAGFISLHMEHAASGIEDLPACVNRQAGLGVSTKHSSVKAILQWIWIIADVMSVAGFSVYLTLNPTWSSFWQWGKHTITGMKMLLFFCSSVLFAHEVSKKNCGRDQNLKARKWSNMEKSS